MRRGEGSLGDSLPAVSRGDRGAHETTRAYDLLAPRFDALQSENAILAHVARVSQRIVEKALQDCASVVELGCGTGRETLPLAALGKRVVACDPSTASLRLLEEKAEQLGLSARIETRALRAAESHRLVDEFGAEAFQGGFSSFALSYEPDLVPVAHSLVRLIEPGGPFVCSIYNRYCLSELVLLAPFLIPRRALRRLLRETRLPVDRYRISLWSYSATEVEAAFAPHFTLEGTAGLPAILPPNYLHRLVEALGGLRHRLEELDARVSERWPFNRLGSHTAYRFRAAKAASRGRTA